MNTRTLHASLPLTEIIVADRLRETDEAQVELLAENMAQRGLRNPIEVRPLGDGRFELVAGMHRLTAARRLGWTTIAAHVVAIETQAEARLLEIEENLVRHDLTELDRAVFLAEWKALYTEQSGARGRGRPSKKIRQESSQLPLPFGEAVKDRLRLSARSVNAAVKRATSIPEAVRKAISGTWIADHAAQLDALAKLDAATQMRVARALTAPEHPAKNVAAALRLVRGDREPVVDVDAQQFRALQSAWRKAGAKARRQFVAMLTREGALPGGDA